MNTIVAEPRLLDRLRQKIQLKGYSRATEDVYAYWAKRYILFHGKRHPGEMALSEIEQFLSDLASKKHVSASAQNQAL